MAGIGYLIRHAKSKMPYWLFNESPVAKEVVEIVIGTGQQYVEKNMALQPLEYGAGMDPNVIWGERKPWHWPLLWLCNRKTRTNAVFFTPILVDIPRWQPVA